MPEQASTTETASQAPAAAEPAAQKAEAKPGDPAAAAETTTSDEFKSEESKKAVLADLNKEREARKALQQQFADLQDANKKRDEALALALGVKEAPKSEEDLAETVKTLQKQIADDRYEALKQRLAATHKVDDAHLNLLTETDPEKLEAQAKQVGELLAAKGGQPEQQNPAFQSNPGQGMGGNPSDDAADEAEYRKYYPNPNP